MLEYKIEKHELNNITAILAEFDLFKNIRPSILKDLASTMTYISLKGGETLIRQGEQDYTAYILLHGRLRVFISKNNNSEVVVGEISIGQIVGEMALLTERPRIATVRAIRDSLLLKLDRKDFKKFEERHPLAVVEIAKVALSRVIETTYSDQDGANIGTITVAPAGDSNHIAFAHSLAQKLNQVAPTLFVNAEYCNHHFNREIAQTELEGADHAQIRNWLQSLENRYRYIIYVTDRQLTPWTQRCLRQADRILLTAEMEVYPVLNSIEIGIFSKIYEYPPFIELVLIHPDQTTQIRGTSRWLAHRKIDRYHHLKLNSDEQFSKFTNCLISQAIGVVLNGGGARGFVHLGVLQALDELKIPIDGICGTSVGAVMAGIYAMGMKPSERLYLAREFMRSFYRDYTFPLVSLMQGKVLSEFFQTLYGNAHIEDLWTNFFCVSTNVTEAKLQVHEQGPLWLAIRASTAIPGAYPPVYDELGNMLVDGSVMNNMPVDIMRERMSGGKILAVNCHADTGEFSTHHLIKESWVSGWKLLFRQLNPFSREKYEYDGIVKIIISSLTLSASVRQKRLQKQADYLLEFNTAQYGILEFQVGQQLIELGYRVAMEKLPHLLKKPGKTAVSRELLD